MKTIQTLFDTEILKEEKELTPIQKLIKALRKDLSDSIYKYKIKYNRVYYGKVENFPAGITKDVWLEQAELVWNLRKKEGAESKDSFTGKKVKLKLLDIKKANV
jgi:hypothetical protein